FGNPRRGAGKSTRPPALSRDARRAWNGLSSRAVSESGAGRGVANCARLDDGASLVRRPMANSPRDGRSGSGPLDTDQAERLAELFQPSWEVGSGPKPAPPRGRAEMEKYGTTTAPEVPAAHKKTLVGLPVPTPILP